MPYCLDVSKRNSSRLVEDAVPLEVVMSDWNSIQGDEIICLEGMRCSG